VQPWSLIAEGERERGEREGERGGEGDGERDGKVCWWRGSLYSRVMRVGGPGLVDEPPNVLYMQHHTYSASI
jgi:hypothetical protein